MTSITYGHGYLSDCDDTTGWTESNIGLGSPSLTVENGDYFKISGTCDDIGEEYVSYQKDFTNISSDIYKKILIRWKTSVSSNGLGAMAILVFTGGSNQYVLGASAPEFSTEWTVTVADITAGKTIDKIGIFADDNPDSVDSGTYSVYYDFILLCKENFVFPNVGYGLDVTLPPRYAIIPIPRRVGDITQNLGSELTTVRASCDLDIGDNWKRPQNDTPKTDTVNGQVFYEIAHNTSTEPWQWLDTGSEQFKVTMEPPVFRRTSTGNSTRHILDLTFREYRKSCASNESYIERFGLNL